MLATLTLVTLAAFQTIPIDSAVALGGVMSRGRHPIPTDPVIESLVKGSWQPPKDWAPIKANPEGWFEDRVLRSAYVYMPVEAMQDGTMLLDAAGHTMVYVNGVPRAGDPYGYGYLTLPVRLRKGRNDLLFVSGRGRIRASLRPVAKPVELDTRDLTTPDVLPTDRGLMHAAVVVRNSGPNPLNDLWIEAVAPDGAARKERVTSILGETVRKVPFRFPAFRATGEGAKLKLRLIRQAKVLDEQEIPLRLRGEKQTYKRTFVSGIDGSVQYYVVNPAQKPGKMNHLVLTVHGASVEATSQADAYASKDDVTIVAATNRRPYGFDWEDWGRMDALEVLEIAKKTIPHDPLSVHITGHSMGGHGTWYIGTLYPDLFASVSPAAGWISFWSYGGGWAPENPTPAEALLRRSMNASDVIARLSNTHAQGLFVLHGDADDNVPVTEARRMKEELTKIGHRDFGYHEVPGAGHWWSNEAVDFAGIFETIRRRRLDPDPERIDFTTPNPTVSSKAWWARVVDQEVPLEPSRIRLERSIEAGGKVVIEGTTTNVKGLELKLPHGRTDVRVILDDQTIPVESGQVYQGSVGLDRSNGRWEISRPFGSVRSSLLLKDPFQNRMAFVYGTHGTAEENEWARNKARFDAETWYYRGNGSVDVLPDTVTRQLDNRNLILYGNQDTNKAFEFVDSCIGLRSGRVGLVERTVSGGGIAALFVGNRKPSRFGGRFAAIGGTGIEGMRRTDRLPVLAAGTAYPSWTLIDDKGIVGTGFGSQDNAAYSAWRD